MTSFLNIQEPKVKGTKPALPFKCYWVGFSPHTCTSSRNGLGSVKDGEPHFVVVHCTGYIKAWPPAGRKVEFLPWCSRFVTESELANIYHVPGMRNVLWYKL